MPVNEPQDVPIREEMIRLGQFLKLAAVVEDGAQAKTLLADGAVAVNGQSETRRGRQLAVGDVVSIDLPAGAVALRVSR
ncbi:MAG TPA: RNA-binding S4 domain-containing protein [Beutenbergiaceae bacterium]|nr:RNA-binding S4 domain-containing protein [Beutenbergiaceae bacterium]